MILRLIDLPAKLPPATTPAQWTALVVKVLALVAVGVAGLLSGGELKRTMASAEPGVKSSWGGLGGNGGGWAMSPSLVWLLITLVLLVLFAALALQLSDGLGPVQPETAAPTDKPGATPEKAADKPADRNDATTKPAGKDDSKKQDDTKKESTGKK